MARWQELGWNVIDSHEVSVTPEDYRNFVQHSRGEFSVAKNLYVDTRSGWFSCRSVCYLASGLPVVIQDTGFSEFLPTGNGLFAFSDGEQAAAAIREIVSDYQRHQQAAREMAREYFGADRILGKLLVQVGL
jgi:glycosyltransferase involved in cell wall biosynthesis